MKGLDTFEVTPADIAATYTVVNGSTPVTGQSVEMLEKMGIFSAEKGGRGRQNFNPENRTFDAVHLISSMAFWKGSFSLEKGRQPQLRGQHKSMSDFVSVVMGRDPDANTPYVHANAGLGRLVYCLNGGPRTQNLVIPKQVNAALSTLDDVGAAQPLREKAEEVSATFGLMGFYLNRHTVLSQRGLCISVPSLLSESDSDERAQSLVRCINLVDEVGVVIEKDKVTKEGETRHIRRLQLRGVSHQTVEQWRSLVGGVVESTIGSLRENMFS